MNITEVITEKNEQVLNSEDQVSLISDSCYQQSLTTQSRVLVVEDDLILQEAICDTLMLAGCDVFSAPSAEKALEMLKETPVDLVISDVNMGGMDGHQLLKHIKLQTPYLPVVLITAYASIQRSVEAIQQGAVDYLVKPFDHKELVNLVSRYALGAVSEEQAPIIEDPASRELFALADKVAKTDLTILIAGESGVGKEVLAQYIHANSNRSARPFVAINCAAIPETMLEATLFGHEKGAFTGAHQAMPGKFEQANGGTLLLDEVSEMDLSLQAKLLRVLQEQEVERLGGRKVISLDVRVIATTNRNLRGYVEEGNFREDLFYRLSVFPLTIKPLAERPKDIVPLAKRLLLKHIKKMGKSSVSLSSDAEQKLQTHHWPGNVRELDNIIQRALILQSGLQIQGIDLLFDSPSEKKNAFQHEQEAELQNTQAVIEQPIQENERVFHKNNSSLSGDVKNHEFQLILDALTKNHGSRQKTAEQLGISPRTLRYKMAKMREEGIL